MQNKNLFSGTRVVRGADWVWGDQDGFEGLAGTVVKLDFGANKVIFDGTVFVQWDTGNLANYRIGRNSAYDLRLFDTSAAGRIFAFFSRCFELVAYGSSRGGHRGMCPLYSILTPNLECYKFEEKI
jgi:hypothetical protein